MGRNENFRSATIHLIRGRSVVQDNVWNETPQGKTASPISFRIPTL